MHHLIFTFDAQYHHQLPMFRNLVSYIHSFEYPNKKIQILLQLLLPRHNPFKKRLLIHHRIHQNWLHRRREEANRRKIIESFPLFDIYSVILFQHVLMQQSLQWSSIMNQTKRRKLCLRHHHHHHNNRQYRRPFP